MTRKALLIQICKFLSNVRSSDERTNMLYFETLIQNKAKSMLRMSRFRDFLKFSFVFSIAVGFFLQQEKESLYLEDWSDSLALLHEQFSWPYLDNLPIKRRDSKGYMNDDVSPWHRRPSIQINPHQKKIVGKREIELRGFLKACIEANSLQMGLLLATMLLDLPQITSIFDQSPDLYERWLTALKDSKKAIYLQLQARIQLN